MASANPIDETNVSDKIAAGLALLRDRFWPEIESRVAILNGAARSFNDCAISEEEHSAGHAAAHKLAGILGTFGLSHGTELARRAEHLLAGAPSPGNARELLKTVHELTGLIEANKAREAHKAAEAHEAASNSV